jgi:FAD/FMN-containing dehydrogenase
MIRFGAASLVVGAMLFTGCAWLNQRVRPDAPATAEPSENPVQDPIRPQAVPAAELWRMPSAPDEAEQGLRTLLTHARAEKLPVAIAGARQSLGGQAFTPGGIILDMRAYRAMSLDAQSRLLRVRAGARWKEVLAYLNERGFSPAVMQAYNDFTVGGSLSVNCHGAQPDQPAIAESVQAFRLMLANGQVVRCSRSEHADLFKLALGGYGLFGVILDAELRVVPNERYRVQRFFVRPEQFASEFATRVSGTRDVGLAETRLSVAPGSFLREGILTVYTRAGGRVGTGPLPESDPGALIRKRYLQDAIGSTGGKLAMWEAEKRADTGLRSDFSTRNELLNQNASALWGHEGDGQLVRQEYFLPRRMLAGFIEHVREVMPGNRLDLLEATVAAVKQDNTTVLRYADQPMFALTLVFHQPRNEASEEAMEQMSQQLIDAALVMRGRYYLPYRLHATPKQFQQAYPQAARFFAAKRRYDPEERFQNQFYLKYGK